jgi:hypothetical protein
MVRGVLSNRLPTDGRLVGRVNESGIGKNMTLLECLVLPFDSFLLTGDMKYLIIFYLIGLGFCGC